MAFQQGAIVLASDPFKEGTSSVRPFVIINTSKHPFHGRQYTMMTLSTRDHDDGIEMRDDYLLRGELARRSFALPWSVTSVQATEVTTEVACVKPEVVEVLITELVSYIAPSRVGAEESAETIRESVAQ